MLEAGRAEPGLQRLVFLFHGVEVGGMRHGGAFGHH
jgi:hypothetical protein